MIPPINPIEKGSFFPQQHPPNQFEKPQQPQEKQAETFEQVLEKQQQKPEISPKERKERKEREDFLIKKMGIIGEQTRVRMEEVRKKLEKLP